LRGVSRRPSRRSWIATASAVVVEGLAARRTLELDDIAFWVRGIHGRPLALRAVTLLDRAGGVAELGQLAPDGCLIKWLYPEAEVIQVATLWPWGSTTSAAKLAIDGYEVNQRTTSAQLNQANRVLATLDLTTEGLAIEAKHRVQVDYTQDKMVKFADGNV
jgi:hypothetical protein